MNTVLLCCVIVTLSWLAGALGSHLYTIHLSYTTIAYIYYLTYRFSCIR